MMEMVVLRSITVRDPAPVKTCAAKTRKREETREGIQKISTPSQFFIFLASSFFDIPRFLVLLRRLFAQRRKDAEKRIAKDKDR
jgi:hypothetical protein